MANMDFSTVEFDFENHVKSLNNAKPKRVINPLDTKAHTVVCIHWLQGLCQKMERCEYLHKLDKTRMPLCKHGSQCRIKNCLMKHESMEEKEECPFFLQGFCMHGPLCKFRHTKRPPDECPDVVNFEELMNSMKKRKASAPNQSYKISICKHWLEGNTCPFGDGCNYAHGEQDLKPASFHDVIDDGDVYDPVGHSMDPVAPLAATYTAANTTFFILQAPDLVSLAISKKRGVWSANMAAVRELSFAKEKSEHVVLFFSVNPLFAIYGVAELHPTGLPIPAPLDMGDLSVNFPVKWLRTFRLSVRTTFQLRLGNGMHLGKLEADGRLDANVGSELMLMACRKPEWDWTGELALAQTGGHSSLSKQDLVRAVADLKEVTTEDQAGRPLFSKQWVDRTARCVLVGALTAGPSAFNSRMPFNAGQGNRGSSGPAAGMPGLGMPASVVADYYPGSQPGFVVGCTTDIIAECFQKNLFGLPIQLQTDALQGIQAGTPLFLQDVNTNLLHGLFEATSPAALNLDAQAFTMHGKLRESMYPVQVKFSLVLETPPIQDADPEVMAVFGGRRSGHRIGPLNLAATKRLSNIFAFRVGAWSPTGPPGMQPPGGHRSAPQQHGHFGPLGGTGASGAGSGPPPPNSMYKPPYPFVEAVMTGIPFHDSGIYVRKRIMGNQSSNILGIISDVGATQSRLKIRMRGIGSGYREGLEQMELQEPMQFCVSADSQELLDQAVGKLKALLDTVRGEFAGGQPSSHGHQPQPHSQPFRQDYHHQQQFRGPPPFHHQQHMGGGGGQRPY